MKSLRRSPLVDSFCRLAAALPYRLACVVAVAQLALISMISIPAIAEKNPNKPTMQILHKPVTERSLPPPGQSLTISAELIGTREISLPLRLVAVRDGRLLPVPLTNSYRNEADRPVYEFELAAPIAELSYQFVLPLPEAAAISSERVVVRRQCMPALNASTAGNANHSELEQLAIAARVLEQEIEAYSAALTAAEALQKEVSE